MKYIFMIFFLVACGTEPIETEVIDVQSDVQPQTVVVEIPEPVVICYFEFPGMTPLPIIVGVGDVDEIEKNPYVHCEDE